MPQKQKVKVHVALDRDRDCGAVEFEGPDVGLDAMLFLRARMDAEEGQISTPREGIELTAGKRDAVDFMERIREESDSRRFGCHRQYSSPSANA